LKPVGFFCLGILALAGMSAHAGPYGFKDFSLGSHITLAANNPKYECRAVTTPTADQICSLGKDESETLAGARVESLFLFYDQSLLTGLTAHVPETAFHTVVSALETKYGPSARRTETLRNLKGDAFENQIHTWHQSGQSITAQRYAGRLDRASVRIADDQAVQRVQHRRAVLKHNPAGDL